jgi:hypothetical protein
VLENIKKLREVNSQLKPRFSDEIAAEELEVMFAGLLDLVALMNQCNRTTSPNHFLRRVKILKDARGLT